MLFGLQETLSAYGAWYLVIVGGLAVVVTLLASRGLWGFASERFGWSLFPVGYWVRQPRHVGHPVLEPADVHANPREHHKLRRTCGIKDLSKPKHG